MKLLKMEESSVDDQVLNIQLETTSTNTKTIESQDNINFSHCVTPFLYMHSVRNTRQQVNSAQGLLVGWLILNSRIHTLGQIGMN